MRADELQFYLSQLQPYKGNYLQKRGILKESIESRFFKDTLFIREVKNKGSVYRNVCIKMYNENGVQAISQRNETFKGIIGGKFDCLATSNHDKSRPIDILYIGGVIYRLYLPLSITPFRERPQSCICIYGRDIHGRTNEAITPDS